MTSIEQRPILTKNWIDPHAFGIVKTLKSSGFKTYLVGGCVRDLLIGIEPKDYDIATSAQPNQVKRLISMAFVIGKRFRLVLVKRDDQQYEVSTFRKATPSEPNAALAGPILDDNLFGTSEEDAQRRDFTINGLFYDPITHDLLDYVGGMADIRSRTIRMIGDPQVRLEEDPIRIMRALRLAYKIGFSLETELRQAMTDKAATLLTAVLPRKREELLKWLRLGQPSLAFVEAMDLRVLENICPTLAQALTLPEKATEFYQRLEHLIRATRSHKDPVCLFGCLLFAYARAMGHEESETEFFETTEALALIRDEIGMYKFEHASFTEAVEILKTLKEFSEFTTRHTHQHVSIMKRDGFELALMIAEADHLISPYRVNAWRKLMNNLGPKLQEQRAQDVLDRKARRRKRKPRNFQADLPLGTSHPSKERKGRTRETPSREKEALKGNEPE